jgi:hypothetical protein
VRLQGKVGDDARSDEAELLVERPRAVLLGRIEREQGASALASDALGREHQRARHRGRVG